MFKNKDGTLSLKKLVTTCVVAVLIIIIATSCFVVIPAGHTGVMVTMGKVSDIVLQEGMSFKLPFVQQVVQIDNRIIKLQVSTQAFSKDLQTITAVLAVNYRIDKGMSYSIYKNVGSGYEAVLIEPAVNEVLKAVIAQHTASELVADRSAVS
ncbi:MAG: prohibitin family protein, partial [Eubacteriales bacterium]|nr:prohibitin family protein [Eubacteriales bacterium]